jgi:shikimate dehydrogenase
MSGERNERGERSERNERSESTRRVGLVGFPIHHSLSPAMHNAVYHSLGLNWHYELIPCRTVPDFERVTGEALAPGSGFVGLNVTMPWKRAAYAVATAGFDTVSGIVHAANVLTVVDAGTDCGLGRFRAANTDGAGLARSLTDDAGAGIEGATLVICGTGAVAATAFVELRQRGAGQISVVSRDATKACKFIDGLPQHLRAGAQALSYADSEGLASAIQRADIIIDSTPTGMAATDGAVLPTAMLRPGQLVLDVVYGHGETQLLRAAHAAGARAIDGLGMLVEQAALSIEIWFAAQKIEQPVPRDLLWRAALAAIERREMLGTV